ncbi:PhzF family phenazine biosynthesis protein [Streptomyces sp. NPDC051555]|uniref:PhzF family phenazine biosynthesis protein n=1 Tax=Streptomyces sp. NPDC051555 TaxID=3365657 RepID=UPI00379104FC
MSVSKSGDSANLTHATADTPKRRHAEAPKRTSPMPAHPRPVPLKEHPVRYLHVDVFTGRPYTGNSLAVFPEAQGLTAAQMLAITRELRHFESVFLTQDLARPRTHRARIFDLAGELDFAGHPLIGAAAVLHALEDVRDTTGQEAVWALRLTARTVRVATRRSGPRRYESTRRHGHR